MDKQEVATDGNTLGNFVNLWQLMAIAGKQPFWVSEFENASGTISYRVNGSWKGVRTRENYTDRASADAVCNDKNAEALKAKPAQPQHLVQTRLTEVEVRRTEAAVDRIADRWPLEKVLDAGIAALESAPTAEPVSPLAEEWFVIFEGEVEHRWFIDLRARVRHFMRDHPGLTTNQWDRALTRRWLDRLKTEEGTPYGKTSKANMRTALHRFGAWLVETGRKKENPAGGIRISGRKTGAQLADGPMPPVFSTLQCEALLYACQLGACRRLLGWMSGTLTTGLRPESEAPRLTWHEINFESGELTVMARKGRGAKPRIIPLTPMALAWLKVVKADGMEKPMFYSRRIKKRAVELANAWLAEHHPKEKPIAWDEDITRHTFASHRAAQIPVHKLAEEMGNSPGTIYAHYRHPRTAAEVKAFWAMRPKGGT